VRSHLTNQYRHAGTAVTYRLSVPRFALNWTTHRSVCITHRDTDAEITRRSIAADGRR